MTSLEWINGQIEIMNREIIDILTDILEILERLCMSSNIKFAEDKRAIWDKILLTYDKAKALEVK